MRLLLPIFPAMEALLDMERSIYPYFCPGTRVFIASTHCCNECCRNRLSKAFLLEFIWAEHMCMLAHGCAHTHTHPSEVPISSPSWSHAAGQVSQGGDQGCHGCMGTASPPNLPQVWPLFLQQSRAGQDPQTKSGQHCKPCSPAGCQGREHLIDPFSFC